jgi:hypothetical protein
VGGGLIQARGRPRAGLYAQGRVGAGTEDRLKGILGRASGLDT